MILHKSQKNLEFRNLIFFAPTAADAAHYVGRTLCLACPTTAGRAPANPNVDDAYHMHEALQPVLDAGDSKRNKQATHARGIGVADVMKKGWNLSQ